MACKGLLATRIWVVNPCSRRLCAIDGRACFPRRRCSAPRMTRERKDLVPEHPVAGCAILGAGRLRGDVSCSHELCTLKLQPRSSESGQTLPGSALTSIARWKTWSLGLDANGRARERRGGADRFRARPSNVRSMCGPETPADLAMLFENPSHRGYLRARPAGSSPLRPLDLPKL